VTAAYGGLSAEAAGVDVENELSGVLDALPGLVWTALRNGDVQFVNRRWREFTGLTADVARGAGWQAAVHPGDIPGLLAGWRSDTASGESHEDTVRLRQSDGTYRWFLFQSAPLFDSSGTFTKWCGTGTDVDALASAESELRRSREFLAKGQRLSSTGSFSWRVGTDDIEVSDEFRRIHELEPDVHVSLDQIAARVHPEDLPTLAEKVELARKGGDDLDYEIRLLLPDGSIKFLHTNAYFTRDASGALEIIGATQDITARKLADNALIEARSELERVARVSSMGALSASIAHEVSQPLSGIITNAGSCLRFLAADPPNTDAAGEAAQRIVADGKRASEVITRLRSLFAKKSGSAEGFDLSAVAREVVVLSANELQRNRVVVREELASDLPHVKGDRVQLQQVILNLLLNASDAMGEVEGRARQIVLKTEPDEIDGVRLSVQDAGTGIAPHNERKIFEPFYTTKAGGMGIGLSISHSIIDRHRGRLWATANDGHGATFSFTIPSRPH
jgi:PAS domain S-box-containing protein